MRDQAQRRAESVTNAVIGWLDARAQVASADPAQHMFLFVHYFDVHWPYNARAAVHAHVSQG